MRKAFVAGNWKMNGTRASAAALAERLREALKDVTDVDVAVCPPFAYLPTVADRLDGSRIALGGQNLHWEADGAFTGEVSGLMLKDIGCTLVIVGHSERRHLFGETDDTVKAKLAAAMAAGLDPILCVGELLEEREAGGTEAVVGRQVRSALADLPAQALRRVTIAYEPVWAIGTGRTATPDQAQRVHEFIRGLLAERFDAATADACRLQYGGSVKPENAADLLSQPDIDGALVGGASLSSGAFEPIVRAAPSAG